MHFKKLFVVLVAVMMTLSLLSGADHIEYKELPKPVKLVFDKAFGKDNFKFEKIVKSSRYGKSIYKIRGEVKKSDTEYDITIYEDGTIFKIDRETEAEDDEEDKERDKDK